MSKVAVVSYSVGGRLLADWLAESLRGRGFEAQSLASPSELRHPDEDRATVRGAAAVLAIINQPEDARNPGLFFDAGATAIAGGQFLVLLPEAFDPSVVPEEFRPNVLRLEQSAFTTAQRIEHALAAA